MVLDEVRDVQTTRFRVENGKTRRHLLGTLPKVFREAFAKAPGQALRSIGHADAAPCMALKAGQTLASPAQIKAQRSKLEEVMTGIQGMDCALASQEN